MRRNHNMTVKEKVAYLKGLAEGLDLGTKTKEDKLFNAIIDTLTAMADEIEELGDEAIEISEGLDAVSEDLADVEEFLFEDEFDTDDDFDLYDEECDEECSCPYCSGASFSYTVECPACGAEIELDEDDLNLESVECPACGEVLEYDFDDVDDDEDDEDEGYFEEKIDPNI